MRKRLFGAAFVLVLFATLGGAGRAHAMPPPGCDSVITVSTTITSNVGPCNQGGIVIAASGVTLDLGGHTVQGRSRIGVGVGVMFDHVSNSRVTNGTVTGFDAGVQIMGGDSNRVDTITASGNIAGAKASKDLGDGITIFQSNHNTVTGNTVSDNGPFSGISVVGDATAPSIGSADNIIASNTVTANNVVASGAPDNEDDGIRIEGPNATGTVVESNTVSQSGLDGIAVFADQATGFPNTGTHVLDNNVFGNGFNSLPQRKGEGIVVFGSPGSTTVLGANSSTIGGNTVENNAADGIRVASTGNVIESNMSSDNDAYPGVVAWDLEDANMSPPCDSNTWRADTFVTRNQTCIA